nr:hypothetical protein [Tanacetum cinerariifolium]
MKNSFSVQDLFKKMEAQPEITQNISSLKLPMLKTREYDLWTISIVVPPKTKAQKLASKNELKAKTTLLLAILDEHLLKFYSIKDAKSLWEAIKIRFEKLISQLELNGEVISQEDANMKLMMSLPLAWNNIALIMRNKPDIETLSMDDLHNILKVYEAEIKRESSSSSNSHNVAFVSSKNTSSINETVNVAHDIPTAGLKEQPSASSYADDVMFSFFVAMITMMVKKFMKKIGRNLDFNGKEPVRFDKTRVECYNFHRRGHFAREYRTPRNQGNRSGDNERRVILVETPASALVQLSENKMPKCEIFEATSDSSVSEIDEDNNQAKDRYKVGIGYHAVPPPYTGNHMPPRADISFAGLDDLVFKFKISETKTSVNENESIASKSSEEIREELKTQSSAASTSTARLKVNTAAIRPTVNAKSSYLKPHFPKRRHFNQRSAAKTNTFSRKINTAKGKNITTAGPKAVVNAAERKKENATEKVKKVNDQEQIQALVDKKKVIITEDSIRSGLCFDDAEGTAYLLNEAIFKGLKRMRFLQVFLDKQVEGMARHKEMYIISSHTKKIFANMMRIGTDFSKVIRPLFDTMMVQAPTDMGDTPEEGGRCFNDESEDDDHVLTPSSDPLPSGEDSFILNELMVSCTNLQEQVLDLQEAKDAQAKEIATLKKKVTKLNKWRKSRSEGIKRLKKFGSGRTPMEKDSLGAQEDASKQGRMSEEIDQNAEIALDDETQRRTNDDEMFGVDDLAGEEVVMDTTTGEHEEQIIKDISTAEPVTTASYKTRARDEYYNSNCCYNSYNCCPNSKSQKYYFHEQKQSQIHTVSSSKDKGKAKMIEPEVPIKKKDQMRIDEEYARKLKGKEQEAARLSRAQQDEEANNSWDNIQAMMDADRLLAERLQAREREEFSEVQKARLSFDEIKKLFDREMRKVNDFIAMDSEAQESSTKRTAEHLESDISKKQKADKNVKPVIDDSEELKKCMEIVPDDRDEVLIEATPLSSRSPSINDYKIHKEGKKTYFKIIRADGNSQVYQTFEKMFKNINREDLEVLWAIVKDIFKKEKPMDDIDNLLFRTLKTMFEHHVEDTIQKYQQGLAKVKSWKLFESCRVYCITMQSTIYYLLVEKVYPFTRNTLHQL